MKELFLNSGVFTSLDAVSHWANRANNCAGVIECKAYSLIQFERDGKTHYRMLLHVQVTEEYLAAYLQRTEDTLWS